MFALSFFGYISIAKLAKGLHDENLFKNEAIINIKAEFSIF
jgi:hypothetical protein